MWVTPFKTYVVEKVSPSATSESGFTTPAKRIGVAVQSVSEKSTTWAWSLRTSPTDSMKTWSPTR